MNNAMKKILRKNLNNLNLFWQALNTQEQDGLFTHTSWPNKQWRADFSLPSHVALPAGKVFSTVSAQHVLEGSKFSIQGQLVVMNLSIDKEAITQKPNSQAPQQIITLTHEDDASDWASACGLAFGYDIDARVIQGLLEDPNARVLAYIIDNKIAGTAISYCTGDTLGVHQVGTVPSYRKMGVAAALMDYLIHQAQLDGIDSMSLQASQAGINLYEKLGFKALTKITTLITAEQ
ncbi:MAG: GNAT family N-acetyltransferase [Paraglaciecola sp.]|uniref:GNAT family N-acetyltransferase n=1 Tax=Paraglaciecola sp. TaxID=1920173 RepID=UPI003298AAC6